MDEEQLRRWVRGQGEILKRGMESWLPQDTSQRDLQHCRGLVVAEVTRNVLGTTAPPVCTGEPNDEGRVKDGMLGMNEGDLMKVLEVEEMLQVWLKEVWLAHLEGDKVGNLSPTPH